MASGVCRLCGTDLFSPKSIERGYGAFCWKIINEVERNWLFSNEDFRKGYYNSGLEKISSFLISILEEIWSIKKEKIRSSFKKSFIPSVLEQYKVKKFLTEKQRAIVVDIICGTNKINSEKFNNYKVSINIDFKNFFFKDINERYEIINDFISKTIITEKESFKKGWLIENPIPEEEIKKAFALSKTKKF